MISKHNNNQEQSKIMGMALFIFDLSILALSILALYIFILKGCSYLVTDHVYRGWRTSR